MLIHLAVGFPPGVSPLMALVKPAENEPVAKRTANEHANPPAGRVLADFIYHAVQQPVSAKSTGFAPLRR